MNRTFEQRAKELVDRMTIEEAASQLRHEAPAIARLGIPAYNWWNEALHGVARAGTATVFPQAIALAATFDPEFIERIADAVSTEGRAKYHESVRQGDRGIYKGLTFWSPNVNIFRDPRWGRGQETYGEDPYLTGLLGKAFVRGLQGNDGKYLKAAACAKHFAVHSGPEGQRHVFDARVSIKDLRETYLSAFRDLVVDARVEAVMGAYNRVAGEPCCGSQALLVDILRNEWKFSGHVVSDCWALRDFHVNHRVTTTPEESAALALNHGCDLNCGCVYEKVLSAHGQGLISEDTIRTSAYRLMLTRMKLGLFDEDSQVPFSAIPYSVVDDETHRSLSLESSRRSLVLLKNAHSVLPLDRQKTRIIAVIGPNADSTEVLKGNYRGSPSETVTALEGIRRAARKGTRILYAEGAHLYKDRLENLGEVGDRIAEAVSIAQAADVVILCLGLDPSIEGEEGDASNEYAAGDKRDLLLPLSQRNLLERVIPAAQGKPTVLISFTGGAMDYSWADGNLNAVIQAWYPGALGGLAIGELLFGDFNPSAKLPVTFYRNTEDLPDFSDYSMKNRTYRYFTGVPLYPFGFGLSFTRFAYRNLYLSSLAVLARDLAEGEELFVTVQVTNEGSREGVEISQLYISPPGSAIDQPIRSLRSIRRIALAPGETGSIVFPLDARAISFIDIRGKRKILAGSYLVTVGGHQGDERSTVLSGSPALTAEFDVTGEAELEY